MSDRANSSESGKYAKIKIRVLLADIALSAVLLAVFQIFFSKTASVAASGLAQNFYAACFTYVSVFLFFLYAGTLPLRYFSGFAVEHRFGLSTQTKAGWIKDDLKSAILAFLIYSAAAQLFYLTLRTMPGSWWLAVSVVWVSFSVILARVLPVMIIPLFFRYSPVMDGELRQEILSVGQRSGVRLIDVLQIDFSRKTRKANAALVGLGGTRKVILSDTLVKNFTSGEAGAVVAHELGHFKYRHTWKLLLFSGLSVTAGLFILSKVLVSVASSMGAAGADDLYIFPVIVLLMVLFGIVSTPLHNFFSRTLERQADMFALNVTGSGGVYASVMKKLAAMNLAEEEPARWKKIFLYDHPPVGERIKMAEKFDDRSSQV